MMSFVFSVCGSRLSLTYIFIVYLNKMLWLAFQIREVQFPVLHLLGSNRFQSFYIFILCIGGDTNRATESTLGKHSEFITDNFFYQDTRLIAKSHKGWVCLAQNQISMSISVCIWLFLGKNDRDVTMYQDCTLVKHKMVF